MRRRSAAVTSLDRIDNQVPSDLDALPTRVRVDLTGVAGITHAAVEYPGSAADKPIRAPPAEPPRSMAMFQTALITLSERLLPRWVIWR